MIASFYTANRLGLQLSTAASLVAGGCCAYTQRTYPNGHALGDRVPTASTGPSRPLLHMRLKAFAGPFGVCYQVVTRTTRQLVALSDSHLNSISLHKAAAAVAPSRATTRCPASLLASRRTPATYKFVPHVRSPCGAKSSSARGGAVAAHMSRLECRLPLMASTPLGHCACAPAGSAHLPERFNGNPTPPAAQPLRTRRPRIAPHSDGLSTT